MFDLAQVAGPTIPSTVNPLALGKAITADLVLLPKFHRLFLRYSLLH